ncbi:DNA-processing protein DprA [Planococcus salinarum]|uniref:DNA-processing protein DprA n=1 Tax=Planococcus salinarum TaxID=622695 RepID=UPI000E3D0DEA|nr:DNA-processing protein DprA [Planococcus salinarum]TAA70407.1 DNA-protecting protein DprA [Planococcus salinarum]
MENMFEHRLLALHYIYPKPLNQIKRLMIDDPHLEYLQNRPAWEISQLLGITIEAATSLKTGYLKSLSTPYAETYEKHKIIPISYNHPDYPQSLFHLIDPPAVLYAKGDPKLLRNDDRIGVIGSRKASSYSQKAMQAIIPELVSAGFIIVSGLAKGADAMAHRTAIAFGGKTIAVTGSGFLHPYPKENGELNNIIEETQLAITEYPPYMLPKRWNFPMRNRIISGLAKGVLVTEAEVKSGTLSTIEHALEHGKDIFAIPGDIGSLLSGGPHKLIAEGAKPVWNGLQVLEEYREIRVLKKAIK